LADETPIEPPNTPDDEPADEPPVAAIYAPGNERFVPYAEFHHRSRLSSTGPQSTFLSAVFVGSWFFAGCFALAVLAGVVWVFTSGLFAGASPVLGALLLISLAMFVRGVRRSRAVAALNYVEQAVRLNLPLPQMIQAAEAGERGGLRRRLVQLRQNLEDGHPVWASLDDALPALPPRALSLVAAAERNGRLASTLARLVRDLRRTPQRDPSRAILLRWYPAMLLLTLTLALGGFSVFVLPKYMDIFRDFGLELPALTRMIGGLWMYVLAPVGAVAALVTLLAMGRMVAETVAPLWGRVNFGPLGDLPGLLAWWTPVARGVTRGRGLADVCHVLADASAAGRPMHAALRDAARLNVNVVLRRQVQRWGEAVEQGTPFAEAAREAGMPRLVVGMLATTSARGAADAAGTFEFLARYYDGHFSRAAALLEASLVPAMVFVFAFLVGSAALGLFLPMIKLMNRVGDLSGFN
jgi:type II secretory pathway component PulF